MLNHWSFNDLPRSSAATLSCRKWLRGRTWGQTITRFERPAAVNVAVSGAAHAALKEMTVKVAGIEDQFCKDVQRKFNLPAGHPESFKASAKGNSGRRIWDSDYGVRKMQLLADKMVKAGIEPKSVDWWARERAAIRCLNTLSGQVERGQFPMLDWDGAPESAPAGVSVRLAAGLAHGAPVVGLEGLWIDVSGLGKVLLSKPLDFPKPIADAHYVEASHCEQMWWLRVVFARPLAPEEVKTRKAKATKEEKTT